MNQASSTQKYFIIATAFVALQVLMLYLFKQPLIAESGQILLWVTEPLGPDNSQHIADWYTPSHIIHGILFYWLLGKFFPRLTIAARFAIAVGIEVGWEILENTPWLINHYRQQALAQGYTGDSILNSICDTLAMMVGFFIVWKLPWWGSFVLLVLLEGAALWFIRDGLAFNIIGLFYQFDFITAWQMAR